MAVIYTFGDSITYGSWDPESSGWASLMRIYLDQKAERNPKFFSILYNLGIPGETTRGLIKRISNEMEARKRPADREIVILSYGANDSALLDDLGRQVVPIEEFQANIEIAVMKAKEISKNIIILSATPVNETITGHSNGIDKIRLNKNIESYNKVLKDISVKNNIRFIDVYSRFSKSANILLDEDGIHPNTAGHKAIFELVKDAMEKAL